MTNTHVVTGTLTDSVTVRLEEAVPIGGRVRVILEPVFVPERNAYPVTMAAIRERLSAAGHKPPTRQEVDGYVREERDVWES